MSIIFLRMKWISSICIVISTWPGSAQLQLQLCRRLDGYIDRGFTVFVFKESINIRLGMLSIEVFYQGLARVPSHIQQWSWALVAYILPIYGNNWLLLTSRRMGICKSALLSTAMLSARAAPSPPRTLRHYLWLAEANDIQMRAILSRPIYSRIVDMAIS